MAFTLNTPPGMTEIDNTLLTAGSPASGFVFSALKENASFGSVVPEFFYGEYKNGETVSLPISTVDGYQYQQSELIYMWEVRNTVSNTNGEPSAQGGLLYGEWYVEQNTGKVHVAESYQVGGGQGQGGTLTNDGILAVWTVGVRARQYRTLVAPPPFTDIPDTSFNEDNAATQTVLRQLQQNGLRGGVQCEVIPVNPSNAPVWQANVSVVPNQLVQPTALYANGFWYIAANSGTTGPIEPNWPCIFRDAAPIVDGSVIWNVAGAGFVNGQEIDYPVSGVDGYQYTSYDTVIPFLSFITTQGVPYQWHESVIWTSYQYDAAVFKKSVVTTQPALPVSTQRGNANALRNSSLGQYTVLPPNLQFGTPTFAAPPPMVNAKVPAPPGTVLASVGAVSCGVVYTDYDGSALNPSVDGTVMVWLLCFRGPLRPPAPTLGSTAGGTLGATTYYVRTSYNLVNTQFTAESFPSEEVSLAVAADNLLTVSPGTIPAGVESWNVYVGTSSGTETLQQSAIPIVTTSWTEPTSGLISGSAVPPTSASTFTDFSTQAMTSGNPLPSAYMQYINQNARFSILRPEIFNMGSITPGNAVPLPVSPIDGYSYGRSELTYLWYFTDSTGPNPTRLLDFSIYVDPQSGIVNTKVDLLRSTTAGTTYENVGTAIYGNGGLIYYNSMGANGRGIPAVNVIVIAQRQHETELQPTLTFQNGGLTAARPSSVNLIPNAGFEIWPTTNPYSAQLSGVADDWFTNIQSGSGTQSDGGINYAFQQFPGNAGLLGTVLTALQGYYSQSVGAAPSGANIYERRLVPPPNGNNAASIVSEIIPVWPGGTYSYQFIASAYAATNIYEGFSADQIKAGFYARIHILGAKTDGSGAVDLSTDTVFDLLGTNGEDPSSNLQEVPGTASGNNSGGAILVSPPDFTLFQFTFAIPNQGDTSANVNGVSSVFSQGFPPETVSSITFIPAFCYVEFMLWDLISGSTDMSGVHLRFAVLDAVQLIDLTAGSVPIRGASVIGVSSFGTGNLLTIPATIVTPTVS